MDEKKVNAYREGIDGYLEDIASRDFEEISDNIIKIVRRIHDNPEYFLSWDKEELYIINACLGDLAAYTLQMIISPDEEIVSKFRKQAYFIVAYVEMFDDERHGVS